MVMKRLLDRQLDTKLLVIRHNVWLGSIFCKAHIRTALKAAERTGGHTQVLENSRLRVPKPEVVITLEHKRRASFSDEVCGHF